MVVIFGSNFGTTHNCNQSMFLFLKQIVVKKKETTIIPNSMENSKKRRSQTLTKPNAKFYQPIEQLSYSLASTDIFRRKWIKE